jgi:hypothetical protein
MTNNRNILSAAMIGFAVSLFSSSIFSGLVAAPSSLFPLNSALASSTGNDTEDGGGPEQPGTEPEQPPADQLPPIEGEQPPPSESPADEDVCIQVFPPPPGCEPADEDPDDRTLTAEIYVDDTNGTRAPATILFEGHAEDGETPYTFSWDFDDGQTGTGQTVRHTFQNPGTYVVTLTVTDSVGNSTTATNDVTVTPGNGTVPRNGTTPDGNRSSITNRISVQIQPPACTSASDSEHWNKILFRITSDPTGRIPINLINAELEVLERVNDGGVINLRDIVRYSIVNEPGVLPQLTREEVDMLEIDILDVEYALICFR